MKKHTKLVTLFLAGAMALSLAACSGGGGGSSAGGKVTGVYLSPANLSYQNMRPQYNYYLTTFTHEELTLMDNNTYCLVLSSSTFSALVGEVERRLGKRLSTADLKNLYTLYDHLAIPAEVILMLVSWCTEEITRKYGPGRKPFLSQIRKEGFIWARRGVDTMERAEEYIARLTRLRGREAEVLRLLDIPARPLVEREKTYIAAWDDMGFDDGAIRMAYERTVLKKQSMDWSYMNGILRRWHEKGLHTAAAIQAGDRDPRPVRAGGPPQKAPPPSADQERRARENVERTRRLMEQMKQEGN